MSTPNFETSPVPYVPISSLRSHVNKFVRIIGMIDPNTLLVRDLEAHNNVKIITSDPAKYLGHVFVEIIGKVNPDGSLQESKFWQNLGPKFDLKNYEEMLILMQSQKLMFGL